jgi:hypothetical protein
MARRIKKVLPMPSHIELISEKTGRVREFELSHAQTILSYTSKTKLGNYKLYNTELYQLDENTGRIQRKEKFGIGERLTDQEQ